MKILSLFLLLTFSLGYQPKDNLSSFNQSSLDELLGQKNKTTQFGNSCSLDRKELIAEIEALPRKFKFNPKKYQPSNNHCLSLASYRKELYKSIQVNKLDYGNRKIKIAIIDTGLDFTIPAFKNKIYRPAGVNESFYGLNLLADSQKTYWYPQDNHGHGTHVAGIIVGLFPNALILPIKVFESIKNQASIAVAIDIAIKAKVDIINISFGGEEADPNELAMIKKAEQAGILVVAASGNDNINLTTDKKKYYPASYQTSNIISVMAHDREGAVSAFSNYSETYTDLMALGTVKSYMIKKNNKKDKCMGVMNGTSQATPFVTVTAAILMAKNPKWNYLQVKNTILNSVDKKESWASFTKSSGKLNIVRTVSAKAPQI